ncbi:hypothetical protein [Arthrobacter sp. PsM3]|uniref:hypothetical protein n=1 Tax=Arthrobacter sp. PsM3 TaxID=3030531 RepID=UPI00263B8763|nr:hypothetical protein [Arthrobacter sp. PsM3]MDN4644255.1 hypothetical protein [Arthrobacter sp. PsM3]
MRIPAGSPGAVLCAAAGAALSAVLLLTSCGLAPAPPAGDASESHSQGNTASPSAGTTPAGSPPSDGPPSEGPTSGWTTFTTANGELSFDYPAGWTVKDPGGALAGDFVDVLNAAGKPVAGLRTNIVTGAECRDKAPYQAYDSAPMIALAESGGGDGGVPRYVFESRGEDTGAVATQSTVAAYGITMVPEEAGDTACPMFHLFLWPPGGAFFGGTYNPENNVTPGDPALPYLEKARLYTSTPEYQDIRKMITSLRPAGNPVGAPAGK